MIDPNYEGGGSKLDLNKVANIDENNISVKIQTNKKYLIAGYINSSKIEEKDRKFRS